MLADERDLGTQARVLFYLEHAIQEQAGKPNAKLNSGEARKRANLLQGQLQKRLEELELKARISPLPPVVLGGLLVVPLGLLHAMAGQEIDGTPNSPVDTQISAARARTIIMDIERSLGFEPGDLEFEKLGYDIESRLSGNCAGSGKLRFIKVVTIRHEFRLMLIDLCL